MELHVHVDGTVREAFIDSRAGVGKLFNVVVHNGFEKLTICSRSRRTECFGEPLHRGENVENML